MTHNPGAKLRSVGVLRHRRFANLHDRGRQVDRRSRNMSLLPNDIVDWDYGPHPDRLEDALRFLMEHLRSK